MVAALFAISWNKYKLTLILLMCRIWWAPNNASRCQMGFNSAFKVLMCLLHGIKYIIFLVFWFKY